MLSTVKNGKRVWGRGVFEGGLSRADLMSELNAVGFESYKDGGYFLHHLKLPAEKRGGRYGEAYSVWVDLDAFQRSAKDQEETQTEGRYVTAFTPNTLVEVRFVGRGNSRGYRVGDLWEGVRTQWLRMISYGDGGEDYRAIQADCREWRVE